MPSHTKKAVQSAPLISKEEFITQIEYLKQTRERFDKLCSAMEELSPGFYVDFLPNLSFEERIIALLNTLMSEPSDYGLIEYFVYEAEFGTSPDATITINQKTYTLDSPAALYDALVELNFKKKRK